mmetsp:Transcript_27408/g.64008  ORF Transcript_27408/g.64008 Transcript_27408/m.64008 type:complete len:372 (-) Transcript_27408:240-1355(-)|eukprot:CAMPEP_0178417174 /NCGR_PEP_ID=MMETSP0689_2-20121128/24440_1 /TAXON_ID=160604 /ORGANISM="Amphidinium massartii, Strain CS-259" /LENGTH=371 /DNA_ID=CAMNT_0020038535 /DNA_START=68 /DNA_END=1183 /DNA_ORIENTATION=-
MPLDASWIVVLSTALSGLGSTLSGLHNLYGLTTQSASSQASASTGSSFLPAVAGGVASGTLACLAAKLGTIGTTVSLSALGSLGGCIYASVGALYFAYTIVRLNTMEPPRHAPVHGSPEAEAFPSPGWLNSRVLNWGVVGRAGVGKSSIINAMRGLKPTDEGAAKVGIGHTTKVPRPYSFTGEFASMTQNMARLWDLPGAGTKAWPCSTYVRDAGLRHLDGVLFVTSDVFLETEVELMQQLLEFAVPYYILRNKVDQDILNNAEDNNATPEETLMEIRQDMIGNGCDPLRTFLVSAKFPERSDLEFGLLLRAMAADVLSQRAELPEFLQEGWHSEIASSLEIARLGMSRPSDSARLSFNKAEAPYRLKDRE